MTEAKKPDNIPARVRGDQCQSLNYDCKKPDTCPSCGFVERNSRPKLAAKLGLHWHIDGQSNDAFYECSDPFHASALPPTTPKCTVRLDYLRKLPVDTSAGGGSTGADTRFNEFDDAAHPFRQWWEKHGQYMLSGGGRRESIWAARGWIAREQMAAGVAITGDSLHEVAATRVETAPDKASEHNLLQLSQEFVRMIEDNWELSEETVSFEGVMKDWFLAWLKSYKREITRSENEGVIPVAQSAEIKRLYAKLADVHKVSLELRTDITKLVEFYEGKIAAQAAEIEQAKRVLGLGYSEREGLIKSIQRLVDMKPYLQGRRDAAERSKDEQWARAEAAEALVEEMRTRLLALIEFCPTVAGSKTHQGNFANWIANTRALLDRSRKNKGQG